MVVHSAACINSMGLQLFFFNLQWKKQFRCIPNEILLLQGTSSSSSASSGATTFPHPNGVHNSTLHHTLPSVTVSIYVQVPNSLDDWDTSHHAPPHLLHTFLAFDAQTSWRMQLALHCKGIHSYLASPRRPVDWLLQSVQRGKRLGKQIGQQSTKGLGETSFQIGSSKFL